MSVVGAKVNVGQVVIGPYGNASYPSHTGCNVQNLYQHLRSSKHFRNSVIFPMNMSDASSLSGPYLSLEWFSSIFF